MGRALVVLVVTLLFATLVPLALTRYEETTAEVDLQAAKLRFVTEAQLEVVHNQVYEKVGESAWEAQVKPEFLRAVTLRAAADLGNPLPSEEDIIGWARTHTNEVKRLLEESGARLERVEK